ncbi:MAG: hypothetical protein U1E36_03350 [Rickettsiales bacterium]
MLEQMRQVFKALHIPEPLVEALRQHLQQSHASEIAFHADAIKTLEIENAGIQSKLDKLLDLLLDGSITADTHDAKVQQLKQRQHEILIELASHHGADDSFRITLSSLISVMSRRMKFSRVRKTSKNASW